MRQISVQFNSEKPLVDRNTKEEFYFVRPVQQDASGKFLTLPSAKLMASAMQGIIPDRNGRAMVSCDKVVADTMNEDGTVRYLAFNNAKVLAYSKPTIKREYDAEALASLIEQADAEIPFE